MNAAEDASIDRTMKKRPLDEVSNAHQVIDQDQLLRPAKLLKGSRRGAALLAAVGVQPPVSKHHSKLPSSTSIQNKVKPSKANRPSSTTDTLLSQPLPSHLHALKDIFVAIQTVYEMMKRRGKRTTYENLRPAVEEASSKRFMVSHLYQLHYLMPDAITLEHVNIPISNRNAASSSVGISSYVAATCTKTEQQLLVTLPPTTIELPAALKRRLHCELARHLLTSYREHLQQLLDQAIVNEDISAVDDLHKEITRVVKWCTDRYPIRHGHTESSLRHTLNDLRNDEHDADGGGGGVDTRNTGGVDTRNTGGVDTRNTGGVDTRNTPGVILFRKPFPEGAPDVPTKAIDTIPASLLPTTNSDHSGNDTSSSRILSKRAISILAGPLFGDAASQGRIEKDASTLLDSMPEELRSRSASGIVSMEALRALESNERVHERLSSHSARSMRAANGALRALPKTFGSIRRIFGLKGPSAMKLHDVVKRMKQGGAETLGEDEVKANIECLAKHAPEFMELKAWGSCGTMAVWIQRKCDATGVASKLKGIAASVG